MIKNFDEVKKQLVELKDVINGFTSEAVQLKIIELLLSPAGGELHHTPPKPEGGESKPAKRRQNKAPSNGNKSTPKSNGKGPKVAIEALLSEGYFSSKRTAGDVTEYLKNKKAKTFSLAAVQNALNRLVQNNLMERDRNAETNQLEYWK